MSHPLDSPLLVVEIAIEPKSPANEERLRIALTEMVAEDPSFAVRFDGEADRTILQGLSETQLAAKVDILQRTYGVEAVIGAPQVAYRETLGRKADIDYVHKRVFPGGGEFARVILAFEPGPPGSGFHFSSTVTDGAIPELYIPSVETGLETAREHGLLAGFPVIDFKATLVCGAYHDLDSSARAFEVAARMAFRELREKGSPRLLEPIMKVEVLTPDEYMGDVIGDLNSRRTQIQGVETEGDAQVVTAMAPLGNMFGYASDLRSFSRGRAQFTMQCDHYEEAPQEPPGDPRFPPAIGMRA